MGLSGGSKSTSESGSAQKWAQPFAKAGAKSVQDVFNQNQGTLQGLANQVTGLVPDLVNRFNTGNPVLQAAQGYTNDVLSGKYMNGNPYLESALANTRNNVMNAVNSQYSLGGRYGSGSHVGNLTQQLANAENSARMADYNTQMGRMDQAAQQAPALTQASYIGLPEILQTATAGGTMPYLGSTAYANALGNLFNGGTSTQTQSNGIGGFLQGAGSIMSGVAALSDRRLKRDIRKEGELSDGLGVYSYTYEIGGPRITGVMADEVEKLRPWALGPMVGEYRSVNYSALEAA